ncbi:hypothetical protein [Streptomyces sp. NPDC000878]
MERPRPAPLRPEPPDAGTARRRARTGTCLLMALLVLPFAVGALPGARGVGAVLGMVTVVLATLVWFGLCEESTPARHSTTRITARTLTGMRAVDLTRLTDVRLLTFFSYGSVHHTLLVRDADGVWLGITTTAGLRAVRRALGRQPKDTTLPRPRVSRAARAHLHGDRAGQLAAHTVLVFLALSVGTCLYAIALVEMGGGPG